MALNFERIMGFMILIAVGFPSSSYAQSAEELQRQLDDLKRQVGVSDPAAELQQMTGLSQQEMQELSRLCQERHGSDYNAASQCVMQAMQNAREDKQRSPAPTNVTPTITHQPHQAQSNRGQAKDSWQENVFSAQGTPCVSFKWLDKVLQTSSQEHCPARNEHGSCRDIKHRAEFTNVCNSDIEVRWLFSTKYSNWSQTTLRPGASRVVSCLQSLDQCNGQIQWGVRAR